ncbi:hypothetical protein vseg_000194 [Gypsophila vaccaria]
MTYNYLIIVILFVFIPLTCRALDPSPSQWLAPHNIARKSVGLPPLTWDPRLAYFAKSYGARRSTDCAMVHSNGPYGENMYWGSGSSWTPNHAVAGWVSEKFYYNRHTNTCRARTCGHYTQIVWRSTKRIGCARVVCGRGAGVLFVCEYDPPGNFNGERPY